MEEKELLTASPKIPEYKKHYNSPKIEKLGDLRDVTRGNSGFNADGATHRAGGPPSDVG